MAARTESIGNLHNSELAMRGCNNVEQNLEAVNRKRRRELRKAIGADHEKATHWIRNRNAKRALSEIGGKTTDSRTAAVKGISAAVRNVTAANDKIDRSVLQHRQHLWQL